MNIKLNKDGKPRKTFTLALHTVQQAKKEAWDKVVYWGESVDYWLDQEDEQEHLQMCMRSKAEAWERWYEAARILTKLEELDNA